eukprot:3398765-Pleurochrysis_carterae.AAC.1
MAYCHDVDFIRPYMTHPAPTDGHRVTSPSSTFIWDIAVPYNDVGHQKLPSQFFFPCHVDS